MSNIIDLIHNKITFENKEVFIIFDTNNNPWFKAKDVARILGYENTNDAINKHVKMKYKKTWLVIRGGRDSLPPSNMQNNTIFISEAGLYSLVIKSRLPCAVLFQEWVAEEVLPSIRRYGEYKLKSKIVELENQLFEQKNKLAVMPENDELKHVFCVLMKNNDQGKKRYKCIRTQKRRLKRSLDEVMNNDDNYVLIYKKDNIPNGINILNCVKEHMRQQNLYYECENNTIDTKHDFVQMVKDILHQE